MNDDGTGRAMKNGMPKFRLYRAMHLLYFMTGTQREAAAYLDLTLRQYQRILKGQRTHLKLADVQKAAVAIVEDLRNQCDHYEWAALLHCLDAIDPSAKPLFSKPGKGFAIELRELLWDEFSRPLSYAFWHYVNKGVNREIVRQQIRRLLRREPILALRAVPDYDKTQDDSINHDQQVVDEVTLYKQRKMLENAKEPQPGAAARQAKHMRKLIAGTIEPSARVKEAAKQIVKAGKGAGAIVTKPTPQGKPKSAKKPIRPDKPDPRQEPAKTKPPIKVKKDSATPDAAPTVIDDIIAKRQAGEGPSPAVAARLAKLMVQ